MNLSNAIVFGALACVLGSPLSGRCQEVLDGGVREEPVAGVSPAAKARQDAISAKAAAEEARVFLHRISGKLVAVRKSTLDACCPDCVKYGSVYYEEIARANLVQVQSCAANAKGRVATVDRNVPELCKKRWYGDHERNTRVRYRIWAGEGKISVSYNLRLTFPDLYYGQATRDVALQESRECTSKIRDFWARYGVVLNINIDSASAPFYKWPDQTISIHSNIGRANTSNIYWYGLKDTWVPRVEACAKETDSAKRDECLKNLESFRKDQLCLTLLHESGHHLGLEDEYPDPDCPDRPFVSQERYPYSVMRDEKYGWNNIEFYPRHISKLLEPLCN